MKARYRKRRVGGKGEGETNTKRDTETQRHRDRESESRDLSNEVIRYKFRSICAVGQTSRLLRRVRFLKSFLKCESAARASLHVIPDVRQVCARVRACV